ncbi:MAG: hypothetical protein IKQ55_08815 [Kiritimatiellae bacterium]|nr:hypothetical protein [Kiritimatiellia bacterium]
MKKLMSLVALAVVGSVVAASAQEVLSANAVGYVKRTIPAGGLQIVSIPFDNIASEDGSYKFADTQIANDLPQGSSVMFWDAEKQGWSAGGKGAKGWSAAQANYVISAGESFFVKNATSGELEVTAAGEVPSATTISRAYAGGGALSVMANTYPVDTKFADTELANQLPQGSSVMFWDTEKQGWSAGGKGAKGWSAAQANYVVKAGEGFFIKAGTEGTWEAVKPYTWP